MQRVIPVLAALFILIVISISPALHANSETIWQCNTNDGIIFTNIPDRDCSEYIGNDQNESGAMAAPQAIPAIENAANVIGNGKALKRFYDRLYRLYTNKADRVAIYHFGDSHVQSTRLPEKIAIDLQTQFGYKGGETCFDKKVKSVSKKRSKKKRSKGKSARKKNVYVLTKVCKARNKPVYKDNENNPPPYKPDKQGIAYYSYGVISKTFDYFANSKSLLRDIAKYKPDLIIVTLGTNDAFAKPEYDNVYTHIDNLAVNLKRNSPKSNIIFTVPSDAYFRDGINNNYIAVVRKAIINYCTKNNHAYWDLYEVMGGQYSMDKWLKEGLSKNDRIHFTDNGYNAQAELFVEALLKGDNRFQLP